MQDLSVLQLLKMLSSATQTEKTDEISTPEEQTKAPTPAPETEHTQKDRPKKEPSLENRPSPAVPFSSPSVALEEFLSRHQSTVDKLKK